jgi:hypothetical protein
MTLWEIILEEMTKENLLSQCGSVQALRHQSFFESLPLSYSSDVPLAVVVIPRPRTEDPHPSLLRPVHKSAAGIGMEASDVDVVVSAQHSRDVSHAPPDPIQCRDGMVLIAIGFDEGFPDSVPDQAEVGRGGEFDARDGGRLGTVQGARLQQLAEPGSDSAGMGPRGIGGRPRLAVTRRIEATSWNTHERGGGGGNRTGRSVPDVIHRNFSGGRLHNGRRI